jgi:Protein of unknown function (DUF3168)
MTPPVRDILSVSAVTAIVGGKIYRTIAPQGTVQPYIVWQTISAVPGNNLSCDPEFDDFRVQIVCYSESQPQCRALSLAAQAACEDVTHVVFGPIDDYETGNKLYIERFDIETWDER